MPKITLSPTAAKDAAIAAAARTYLEFTLAQGSQECRFSHGTTYVAADSQALLPGDIRIWEGSAAAGAFSFSPCPNGVIDVSSL